MHHHLSFSYFIFLNFRERFAAEEQKIICYWKLLKCVMLAKNKTSTPEI